MARRPRLALSGVPQHVIQRGNNRQATFFAEADYRFYLECLHDASCKYDCMVHAYVLMTNHVHILVTPQRTNGLSLMMQHVGRRYVQYVNYVYPTKRYALGRTVQSKPGGRRELLSKMCPVH